MKIPKSEYDAILAAYEAGESQTEIASRYGVSHVTIGKILKKMGHSTRMGGSNFYQSEIKLNHEYIIQAHNQGYSPIEIGEQLKINNSTVIWVLQRAGLWNPPIQNLEPQVLAEIAARYAAGMSIKHLQKQFSCSEGTVYYALRLHQVQIRPRGYHKKHQEKET